MTIKRYIKKLNMIPQEMSAVLLTKHGALDALEYREDIPVPTPRDNEVLINITAAGVNNTDINTRTGWYSKKVTSSTDDSNSGSFDDSRADDASWSGIPLHLPRIQGADICGNIIAIGGAVNKSRLGKRVLVRPFMRTPVDHRPFEFWTVGSECDGGFAQFCTVPSAEAYTITSDWTDIELASLPCAYSTAENMLHRAKVGVNGTEKILITGASGGVGSAAIQLCKRRNVEVIAMCSQRKAEDVLNIGADSVIDRNANLVNALGKESVDVVIDLVAGKIWPTLLDLLKRGGRYAIAGAIAGPISEIDVRTLYLKDLSLFGCAFQEDIIFKNLLHYVERNEIHPLISATYPLKNIAKAQEHFLSKDFVGKIVLIPPTINQASS